jgi:hypothetical protein
MTMLLYILIPNQIDLQHSHITSIAGPYSMNNQRSLCHIQKLTQKLHRVLEEHRPSISRARSDPSALGDPFEWERVRRSAAPSPEASLGRNDEQFEEGITGTVRKLPWTASPGSMIS